MERDECGKRGGWRVRLETSITPHPPTHTSYLHTSLAPSTPCSQHFTLHAHAQVGLSDLPGASPHTSHTSLGALSPPTHAEMAQEMSAMPSLHPPSSFAQAHAKGKGGAVPGGMSSDAGGGGAGIGGDRDRDREGGFIGGGGGGENCAADAIGGSSDGALSALALENARLKSELASYIVASCSRDLADSEAATGAGEGRRGDR
jgi:hypothetical protein